MDNHSTEFNLTSFKIFDILMYIFQNYTESRS